LEQDLEENLGDLLYTNGGKVTPEQLSKALKSWLDNPHEAIYCVRSPFIWQKNSSDFWILQLPLFQNKAIGICSFII